MLIVSYRLEVKLVTLSEIKADLDAQLHQERRTLGRLRSALSKSQRKEDESKRHFSYLEVMLNKYEQRNYDLEEREVDLRHRLEMLESSIPALIIWNMWRILQNTRISRTDATSRCLVNVISVVRRGGGGGRPDTAPESSVTVYTSCSSEMDSSRLTDIKQERPGIKTHLIGSEEICRPAEEQQRSKFQDLEAQLVLLKAKVQGYEESEDKYKKRITELEDKLDDVTSGSQVDSSKATDGAAETELSQSHMTDVKSRRCSNLECVIKVQELAASEANMKKRIVELERKERAYMETLQKADELWSDMEASYKRQISNAEDNEAVMMETIRKLRESEAKLRQTFRHDEENEMLLEKIQNMEEKEKVLSERIRALEAEKSQLIEEMNHLRETLHAEQKELEKTKDMVARPLKEELLKERRLSRSLQDEIDTMERDSQNRSRDQQAQVGPYCSFN
jgi:chromosome segregation ATPase